MSWTRSWLTPPRKAMQLATLDSKTSGIEMTPTGVNFDSSHRPEYEQVEEAIRQVGRLTRTAQFCLGDLINFAEHEYGSKYDEWIISTGLTYGTLANIASVARSIPISLRSEKLDFHHHRIIAAKLKSNEDRREWLETAAARGLSVRELEVSIKRGKVTTMADLLREREQRNKTGDDRGTETHGIILSKLTRWTQEKEALHGMVDTWEAGVQAQLRQEFMQLHEFMERLYGTA